MTFPTITIIWGNQFIQAFILVQLLTAIENPFISARNSTNPDNKIKYLISLCPFNDVKARHNPSELLFRAVVQLFSALKGDR